MYFLHAHRVLHTHDACSVSGASRAGIRYQRSTSRCARPGRLISVSSGSAVRLSAMSAVGSPTNSTLEVSVCGVYRGLDSRAASRSNTHRS